MDMEPGSSRQQAVMEPTWLTRRLRVLLAVALLAVAGDGRGGNLDVLLCNNANVDLFDCLDLVNLYNSTDGGNWTDNSNWGTPDVDSWRGVIVNPLTGRVISLDLFQNGLDGPFPPMFYGLQALEFLQLSNNGLSGELPAYIGELRALEVLQIGFAGLDGPLPDSLGNLTRLRNLLLAGNRFSGPVPASLGNLTALEFLDLYHFSAGSGGLSGPLPDLSGLTRLRWLGLENNELEGPLPAWIGSLAALEELHLHRSGFSGALPASLGNLSNLQVLDLSYNDFTTILPPTLGNLTNLRTLDVAGNPFRTRPAVTGPIPSSFAALAQLEDLDLSHNQLSGTLPACLGQLASLRVLNVQANDLVGPVPEAFTALWLDGFYIGLNLLDADAAGNLITSPAVDAWMDAIPSTEFEIPGLTVVDSRDQRLPAVDPDAVFASGFESAFGPGC